MAPHIYDPKYPPINRAETGLDILQIRITGKDNKTSMFDPMSLAVAALEERLDIGEPGFPSDISGTPGYRYETCDVTLHLERSELMRVIWTALTPDEFIKLRDRFGVFHEIHDDFYDPETGTCFQPRGPYE